MRGNLNSVKRFDAMVSDLRHGFSLSAVVSKETGLSLADLAAQVGHTGSELSMLLNGYKHRIYQNLRAFLAKKLRITQEQLGELIDLHVSLRNIKKTTRTKEK